MSRLTKTSNTSGICMYCNTFFHRLAAHMLLSETCMLANQDSSSNKRVCSDSKNSNVNLYMHAEANASIDNVHERLLQYRQKMIC